MPHLYLSATHKSSGKTTVSVGLAAALRERGLDVRPFKKGPDYIDPMWLGRAAGRACYNLDFNTQSASEITETFRRHAHGGDIALIEGNKGLYDGLDMEGRDSNAALARLLRAPVLLVLDVSGITRGVAPLILGYQAFDPAIAIAGVILNKVGPARQEAKLRRIIEHYTDVPVLGAIGRDERLVVRERHLGLTTPEETAHLDAMIARLCEAVRAGVTLSGVLDMARSAPPVAAPQPLPPAPAADVRIAIARDSAFGFYYRDDLAALEREGAELVVFNALEDARLPEADGLIIGGGFPETHMAALEANAALRADIRARAEAGLPIYAECGGLMYLTRAIRWGGERREMVGLIEAETVMHERPQGRGLVVLEETGEGLWPVAPADAPADEGACRQVAAHEFHYAALEGLDPETRFAWRVRRGTGLDGRHDGIVLRRTMASFTHLRSTAQSPWTKGFVDFVRRSRAARIGVGPRD